MLNYLWAGMILFGIVFGAVTGNMEAMSEGMIESAKSAVTLAITMLGIMTLWTGMMQIAQTSGLTAKIAKLLSPVLSFLFPELKGEVKAKEAIALNVTANLLGLGWAATPAGLTAMKELKRIHLSKEGAPSYASTAMCTFLILNISSLQLVPVSMIAYRMEYGAKQPTDIVGYALLATAVSLMVGILFAVVMRKICIRKDTPYSVPRKMW